MTAGLLFLDLDGFKTVNDNYGHEAGDAVVEVAARLLAAIRPDDCVLRLGGDEFVAVCPVPAAGPDGPLLYLADRLERAVCEPFDFRGDVLRLGASVGMAVTTAGQTPAQLVEAADKAMYRRKQSRRTPIADTSHDDHRSVPPPAGDCW